MKTIRYTKMDMEQIIRKLRDKGIVAFPTDTVFGLACMMDEEAIARVYVAKGRSFDKPLPVMCDSLQRMKEIAYVDERAEKIINKLTPGPLTLILRKKENVGAYVTMGKDTIGIRIPDDPFILKLISEVGRPLMVTSANVSGEGSLLKWEDVLSCMDGKIDAIVCEDASGKTASTIVDLSKEEMGILRQGPITMKEIQEALL